MAADVTVEILRDIRDGISATNVRLESMDHRLESVDKRLESMEGRLEGVENHLEGVENRLESVDQRLGRTEQGLNDLGRFMRQIALDQARHERFHVHHVDLLQRDVDDLKDRVRRLEEKSSS